MSWYKDLFTAGASKLVDSVGNALDGLITSDEERARAEVAMQKVINERLSELEQTVRSELQAKERVLVAELQQGDSYTKRARPTVVYFGLFMIAINYLIVPLVAMLNGSDDVVNFPLPTEFWAAWGGIVATWAIGRSFEKTGNSNKASRALTGNKDLGLLDG